MHDVVLGALLRGGRVLLVHRRPDKDAYPGVWDLPGGLVEAGESEMDALTRELREELGVRIATGSVSNLHRWTAAPTGAPVSVSASIVREWRGTPTNLAPEEHDDIGWFGAANLPPLVHLEMNAALIVAMQSGHG